MKQKSPEPHLQNPEKTRKIPLKRYSRQAGYLASPDSHQSNLQNLKSLRR